MSLIYCHLSTLKVLLGCVKNAQLDTIPAELGVGGNFPHKTLNKAPSVDCNR